MRGKVGDEGDVQLACARLHATNHHHRVEVPASSRLKPSVRMRRVTIGAVATWLSSSDCRAAKLLNMHLSVAGGSVGASTDSSHRLGSSTAGQRQALRWCSVDEYSKSRVLRTQGMG
jgi:hypothetical protein